MADPRPACPHPDHCNAWRDAVEAVACGTGGPEQETAAAKAAEHCVFCRQRLRDAAFIDVPAEIDWSAQDGEGAEDASTRKHTSEGRAGHEREPPSRLGRYELRGELGRGGMGVTYLSWDPRLKRDVAVKVPHRQSPGHQRRLLREARTLARLEHHAVAAVHDAGVDENTGLAYLVTRYVDGQDLTDVIARDAPIPPRTALSITDRLLEVLAELHPRGVVHRDIKPANIRFDGAGRLLLLDFGIARVVDSAAMGGQGSDTREMDTKGPGAHDISGTPTYMSPEQASGRDLYDPRTDLYAVGVCLREMLAGCPKPDGTWFERNTPPAVAQLVHRACAADRAMRFQSADAFRQAVAETLAKLGDVSDTNAQGLDAPATARRVDLDAARDARRMFLSHLDAMLSEPRSWYDPLRGYWFTAVAGPRRERRHIHALRHGTNELTEVRSWTVTAGLWPNRSRLRIDAGIVVRERLYLLGGREEQPLDLPVLRSRVASLLEGTRGRSERSGWQIVLLHSPTGFTDSAIAWASATGLGRAGSLALFAHPTGRPLVSDDDPLAEAIRSLTPNRGAGVDFTGVRAWVEQNLEHRPAISADDLKRQFGISAEQAAAWLDQLAAAPDKHLETISKLGRILRKTRR